MQKLLTGLAIAAILTIAWLTLIKATDRICEKSYSKEFKQTQEYKNMRCPNK